ncbi:Hsp20/alpha crystallin family protein [Bosea vestrisii]|uniref:Hsp20/alpha crystallin family protein n=1 Tax=Bosea vestrisii TaxID=151416 RepID=UPI0024DFC8CE|nr:Hsp20/alpha crystallin family protein [Bosea vestrisii]WID99249.1 Hsp20/alpha crystallin family protein [Bosea vestrisii]
MSLRKEDVVRCLLKLLLLALREFMRSTGSAFARIASSRLPLIDTPPERAGARGIMPSHEAMEDDMLLSDFGRIGFDPFLEMRRMQQEMNQRLGGLRTNAAQEFPPVNLWLSENSVAVTAELPGIAPDDVDLTVRENTLTLKGERKSQDETSVWHRRERPSGRFSRTIQLPFRVDSEQVEARFANGLLEVELHRPEADRPRKIQIKG